MTGNHKKSLVRVSLTLVPSALEIVITHGNKYALKNISTVTSFCHFEVSLIVTTHILRELFFTLSQIK